ncbi:MAG TPA: arginine deiminase family protein [Agriterribacter sp.]|uniref:arginine deiminase family protein n=1 Tax=Agriterribacter sp. TaxID=2821509 RepID=UPI002C41BC6E|nr:arginine deiminase family protein [Agriterribacter sp.]HRQ17822.1 arginine deiminase family protein [Agriterribacter sp.]
MDTHHFNPLRITSEIGTLRSVLVHTPDSGLGKVVPSKAQDWLFEDIVHLDTIRRKEYDYYTKLLLYFLDPAKIKGKLKQADDPQNNRSFYKPEHPDFFRSEKVVELQNLLADILNDTGIKEKLTASVCAVENCSYLLQKELAQLPSAALAKVFITGSLPGKTMIFPPIPNFIFTRDIGIVIKDHILLNKPAKKARIREALLAKYIFYNHPLFSGYRQNIIELADTRRHFLMPRDGEDKKVTLEGGDVMVVSPNHLLVGVSERTSMEAAHQVIGILFDKQLVNKISVIKIPRKRDYMHIDTVFTQVKRNVWVLLGNFSKAAIRREAADPVQRILDASKKDDLLRIIQFHKNNTGKPVYMDNLEDLLTDISTNDLKCKDKVQFIYSGNNEFPYDSREQWTDSCNLLALKEGVVLGYDRNDKTTEAFRRHGFAVMEAKEMVDALENGTIIPDKVKDTLILIPSAELSRARGGFHCMSMPLLRDEIEE